jgi:hypothetical protein
MKRIISFVSVIGLLTVSQYVFSDSITDSYNTGDTLTAPMLNNIKSAVNDNDARTTSLENSQTVQDTDIGTLEIGQQALQTNDATQDTRLDALEAADLINRITALENALAAHIADLANPHAVTKEQVGLSNLEDIRVNFTATTPPTVNDDINSGYTVGSVWIDVAQKEAYVLVDSTAGVAVWKPITTKTYKIGDTGPAGGIVFYVSDGGSHGFEAAPADVASAQWGCSGLLLSGANGNDFFEGAQNTADILAECAESGIAAEIANNYSQNGYSDWYLPSPQEMIALHAQRAIVGGFNESLIYWTSRQTSGITSHGIDFSIGGDGVNRDRTETNVVRPIRTF